MNIIARADSAERSEITRQADGIWRRAGVQGADRRALLSELEAELRVANQNGHGMPAVLDDVSEQILQDRARERGLCGRALRLELAVPAAVLGLVAGLATPLLVVLSILSPLSAIRMGQYEGLLYVSSGVLGYLGTLLFVWRVLHTFGDPRATSTVRWLAMLLPIGATVSAGAAVAVTETTNFYTSITTYFIGVAAVVCVVAIGIGLTVWTARFLAARKPISLQPSMLRH